MANLFTSPRSRNVVYTPDIPEDWLKPADQTKRALRKYLGDPLLRIASDNVPLVNTLINRSTNSYPFPGVQSAKWTYARDISEQYGLQRFTLLPWYTKAIVVSVTGRYYMGAFTQDTLVTMAADLTGLVNKALFQRVRDELKALDNKILNVGQLGKQMRGGTNQPTRTLMSSLTVGDYGDQDSLALFGFIKSFSITEDVSSPFIQAYTLEYIGVDREWYNSRKADSMFKADTKQINI